jgi:hypothetical protein
LYKNSRGGLAHPEQIKLSEQGKIIDNELKNLSAHYFNVYVDCYAIMPNHIYLIVVIGENQNELTGQASLSPMCVLIKQKVISQMLIQILIQNKRVRLIN